jgi:isopenicillin N synthase-like dioxygenase
LNTSSPSAVFSSPSAVFSIIIQHSIIIIIIIFTMDEDSTSSSSASAPTSSIPVLDLESETAAHDLVAALRTSGFVTVINHGIDTAPALHASRSFFHLTPEQKLKSFYKGHEANRGYIPVGLISHSNFMTHELKESFDIGKEGEEGLETPWPPDLTDETFKDPLLEYWESSNQFQLKFLKLVGEGLHLEDPNFFADRCSKGHGNLRLMRYPTVVPHGDTNVEANTSASTTTNEDTASAFIVTEDRKTDFGTVTILDRCGVEGLRVQSQQVKRKWLDVHPKPGTLVIFVGEILERWTNGTFKAARYEVISKASFSKERYSTAFFCNADKEVMVEPICLAGEEAMHASINSLNYLQERLSVTIDQDIDSSEQSYSDL